MSVTTLPPDTGPFVGLTTDLTHELVRVILKARSDDHPDRFGPVTAEEIAVFCAEVELEVQRRKAIARMRDV